MRVGRMRSNGSRPKRGWLPRCCSRGCRCICWEGRGQLMWGMCKSKPTCCHRWAWGVVFLLCVPALRADPPKLDVPYVPTPQPVVEAMLKLAAVKAGDVVYDLGCGDGRIVVAAVKDFKAKRGVGIDLDPQRVKES